MATNSKRAAPAGLKRSSKLLLTPEVEDAVAAMAAEGRPLTIIADALGIHRDTIHSWIRRGEARDATGGPPYAAFAKRYRLARASYEARMRSVVQAAAEEDPKWASYLLERRFPEEYGNRQMPVSVNVAAARADVQVIDTTGMTLDQLEAGLEGIENEHEETPPQLEAGDPEP